MSYHLSQPKGLSQAIEACYALHVGLVTQGGTRHERPHKPLLLLAVLDLMAQGQATPSRIPWCRELRTRFATYFERVRQLNDQCTPENPFFYLGQEGWWQPFRISIQGEQPLQTTPTSGDATAGTVFARMTAPMADWLIQAEDRLSLRDALVARFFPHARDLLTPLFLEASSVRDQPLPKEDNSDDVEGEVWSDDENAVTVAKQGRSSAFRRIILELYDFQCAACGMRIKLPGDLTFVDATHLIPFGTSQNDHPTNGMALCKNHHWAMDRFLIAPAPEGIWRVSSQLIAHRSPGEKALIDLKDTPFLPPTEPAFHPATEALEWRVSQLAA